MKKIIFTALASATLITSTAFADEDKITEVDFDSLDVSIKEAIDQANLTIVGDITSVSFDVDKGENTVQLWVIEMNGQDLKHHEIKINAVTGEMVSRTIEDE